MIDSEQRQRMDQRPGEAGDTAEITGGELALEEIDKQRAIAPRRVIVERPRWRSDANPGV